MKFAGETQDRVWRAVAEPSRRRLLEILSEGPRTTGELVECLPELSRTAVMRHLDVLSEAGLLVIVREGRERWNYLDPAPLEQVCGGWVAHHVGRWERALQCLREVASRRRKGRRTE